METSVLSVGDRTFVREVHLEGLSFMPLRSYEERVSITLLSGRLMVISDVGVYMLSPDKTVLTLPEWSLFGGVAPCDAVITIDHDLPYDVSD